jgi:hypothetical protein
LDSALVACQGVQDALANLENWLNSTDKELANIMKPASLMRERLDEQIRKVISKNGTNFRSSLSVLIVKIYLGIKMFIFVCRVPYIPVLRHFLLQPPLPPVIYFVIKKC